MFSDGIRPGGDLTELDGGSEHRPLGKRPGRAKPRRVKGKPPQTGPASGDVCTSRMPISGLPFVSGMLKNVCVIPKILPPDPAHMKKKRILP